MSEEIKVLTDYQHVRLRTEMYLGSRTLNTQNIVVYENGELKIKEVSWVPALYTAFREIIDNSLDEVVGHGYGDKIEIFYSEDSNICKVSDNGRGIPIDYDRNRKCHKATLVLSKLRAGRNFGERGEVVGTNGLGASATNYVSEWFKVTVFRNGKKFFQEFRERNEVIDDLIITKPIIKDIKTDKTGTTIEFKFSKEVFNCLTLPDLFVRSRVFEIAFCNSNLHVFYNGERIKIKQPIEKYLFKDKQTITFNIDEEGFKSTFILVPDFVEEGDFIHSIVNNVPAFNGGVHVEAFRKFFFQNFMNALEKESKKRKMSPNRSDICEGLFILNITNMKSPNFDSQSKTRLINREINSIMKNFFSSEKFFNDLIRKNKWWIEKIYEKCSARLNKKENEEIIKASKKLAKRKVPKLIEASSNERSECVLFLTEGDSAVAGMCSVRNPSIHAGMPLRGKVMNVNGENVKKILDNKELVDIMTVVGLKIGEKAKRENLRYGKIFIATDADSDGYNIAALIVNFFYSFWPELFDSSKEPYIYIFLTPFIIAEKGKIRKYWYNYNYNEFKPEEYKGWTITRAKGLGSLTKEDWKYSLEEPKIYPIVDDGKMKESLDLIFNNYRADDRKKWIRL